MLGQITCGNIVLCVRQDNCFILYVKFLYHGRECMIIHRTWYTVNPLISPHPGGGGLFISSPLRGEGGSIETGSLFERGGGCFFNLETTMVSVLYKELEYNVEKLRYKKCQAKQPRIRIKAKLNHPGSVHTKFYGRNWLIQSIIY